MNSNKKKSANEVNESERRASVGFVREKTFQGISESIVQVIYYRLRKLFVLIVE